MSLWGSLQKGVASLESRLDTILGETEDIPQQPKQELNSSVQSSKTSVPVLEVQDATRKPVTSNPANDRLQARLAKAVAARASATSSNAPSRIASPTIIAEPPRRSIDATSVTSATSNRPSTPAQSAADNGQVSTSPSITEQDGGSFNAAQMPDLQGVPNVQTPNANDPSSRLPEQQDASVTESSDMDGNKDTLLEETRKNTESITSKTDPLDDSVRTSTDSARKSESLTDVQRADLENRQEIHNYMEKIDALQAKLQYLSREAVESARLASAAAPSGSLEKKLAQRDEQIALLMEEGQKLSKTEMKYLNVIKGLRSKATEMEKEAVESKKKVEKLEKDNLVAAERLRRLDQTEKQSLTLDKKLRDTENELAAMTKDRDAKANTITSLHAQLRDAESQVNTDKVKALTTQLEQEKRRVSDLESDISSLKIEKELALGRAKVQFDELRAKNEREVERARVAELEMKAEQQMLESRLEVLRTRAEEVSSSTTGDAQVKLLRQIEQLQSQYAIASENWQRIEASITSRATNLERERDEAQKKEVETRRKAREINVKSKRIEDEAEESRSRLAELQQSLEEQKQATDRLQKQAADAESALVEAQKAFEVEKQTWISDMASHNHEVVGKARRGPASNDHGSTNRGESPTMRRGLTVEHLGLQNLQTTRRSSGRPAIYEAPSINRKASSQLIRNGSGRITPTRNNSQQSLFPPGEVSYAPPSIVGTDHDDDFENVATPLSPHERLNDILSVSTVGAGPSVQLVERMSANVRRLESEKVASKEEMARLSAQRDEARAEIVALMSDIEGKKSLETKLKEMEEERDKISQRYQTTLEMLGEKSELVEELRQDVQDIKDMYRELIERTVK